ncbi:MAG TPA: L-threonylcarbamoyladenylate synthase, partial [Gemmatimonadales bacterium]|nr:L-threonylcarbamoyladenylate synthase [Gemmatimonadales bacterium]
MTRRRLVVDPETPDPALIVEAGRVLREGGLVAFPTETVYGLGANALDPHAIARLYEAKGRPAYNPVILHVASVVAARRLARAWPEAADRLVATWWPGPLTLVLPRSPSVPDAVTAGLDAVGIRIPAHPVALALLEAAGVPVAAPSANRSTELSPTTADHVEHALGDRVDVLLDGGPTTMGIESTVVDLTGAQPVLLRPGLVSREEIELLAGPLAAADEPEGTAPRRGPGQLLRHYAPRGVLELVPAAALQERIAVTEEPGVGILARTAHVLPRPGDRLLRMPATPRLYARRLYAALHELDAAACPRILCEAVPDDAAWEGVRDR